MDFSSTNVNQIQTSADESENDLEDVMRLKLKRALDNLAEKVMKRIEHDPSGYNKAIAMFEKTVEKLPSSVDSALQKTLCSFGKSVTQVFLSSSS